jgi:hypothetical protein
VTKRKVSAILLAIVLLGALSLLVLEGITVADSVPSNHITAIVRSAFEAEPGVFLWLAFTFGYLGGHFFWFKREKNADSK